MMRRSVVLPAPLGPISVTISPRCTAMSTPASTGRPPKRLSSPCPPISNSRGIAPVLAASAQPRQLDDAALDGEAARDSAFFQRGVDLAVVEFGGGAATAADQELDRMLGARLRAADEGVERFDAMDET